MRVTFNLLGQIPDHLAVLRRILRLLKPGGLILIEDMDFHFHGTDGPEILMKTINDYFESYGADTRGLKLKSSIEVTQQCGEMSETRIRLPFSPGIDAGEHGS
jgi:hypothetical protein